MINRTRFRRLWIVCITLGTSISIYTRLFPSEYIEKPQAHEVQEVILLNQADSDKPILSKEERIVNAINNNLNGLLAGYGETYYKAGKLYNVNPMLMSAISIHETRVNGICNSNVLKEANNVAGINHVKPFERYGRYNKYETIEQSIYDLSYRLKHYYINQGLKDIDSIGRKYAPLNDYQQGKYGMDNSIWAREVTTIYERILSESEGE